MTRITLPRITYLVAGMVLLAVTCVSLEVRAATLGDLRGPAEKATQTLFEAVHTNDFAATEAAVAAGASIDAKNRWNLTPIELAIDKGYFRIAHFLVSVRNNRVQAGEEAAAGVPVAPQKAARSSAQARTRQPAASRQSAAREYAPQPPQPWPSDMPNPFDPAAPAFGAGLPLIQPARTSSAAEPADGELLATDTPASAGREYRN